MSLKLSDILLLIILSGLISSCGNNSDKKDLQLTEQKLKQKEQQLLSYEQQLNLRERELLKREQLIDSLRRQADTTGTYNAKLIGNWTVTMQCTETTCEGYAVGDTKTEQWNISYQNSRVIVKASANKKLVRSYTGLFRENTLELTAQPPPDAETKMDVVLNPHPTTENLMEGSRVINRGGNCRVVFTLKAEKQ
ncbi:MAG TPA: hypothetical protein VNI52_00170 [Sphingobacteriaceae bacterium]|nr:hypothetical protein [Sphingobacteriaceae bacterium]